MPCQTPASTCCSTSKTPGGLPLVETSRAAASFDFDGKLRVQHSFRRDYLMSFADQSHFTHSFRKLTGFTPGRFNKTFDV